MEKLELLRQSRNETEFRRRLSMWNLVTFFLLGGGK